MSLSHRACVVLYGKREDTLRRAHDLVAGARVHGPDDSVVPALGRTFDAAVVSLHDGLDVDRLAAVAGLVRGGGLLVVCAPQDPVHNNALAVQPFSTADVGARAWHRVLGQLQAVALQRDRWVPPSTPPPPPQGTAEQHAVVNALVQRLGLRTGSRVRVALVAPRGRGKSSALGLATRALRRHGHHVLVTAPHRASATEVFRFAGDDVSFVTPEELASSTLPADVIVVDEAAQLPLPMLRALVDRHPHANIAFATTTDGYEGTGRGFLLRFLPSLPGHELLTLTCPMRWDDGCPVESALQNALLLDGSIDDGVDLPARWPEPVVLDRDWLARDERLLRSVWGLLSHAHYRTTPGDLQRVLDAPNWAVHAVIVDGKALGCCVVAREGGLGSRTCEALARGEHRLRGHVLADNLITHAGRPSAGELSMIRSVRIATHPAARRRHVAQSLVEHVHATYQPDLFGTVFGATAALVRFRRSVGYEVVRLGSSRGARSGEPSVVMLRPGGRAGEILQAELRADLGRDLPLQLRLLHGDMPESQSMSRELEDALRAGLEPRDALNEDEMNARIRRYLAGPQTFEAAAWVLTHLAKSVPLDVLDRQERILVQGRVIDACTWDQVARTAAYPTTSAAMKALRPAMAKLAERFFSRA